MQLPDLSLLLVALLFWACYWVLRVFLFRPLGAILSDREKAVADAEAALQATLEREREELARIDARFTEERRALLASRDAARAESAKTREAALEAARAGARQEALAGASALEAEVAAARRTLEADARAMAADLATRVLGRRVAA